MPAYNAIPAPALYPSDQYTVLSAEASTGITSSQQVALSNDQTSGNQQCVVEGFFSGAPGTFEIDVQFAATDSDAYYTTAATGGAITAVDSNQHFEAKFSPTPGNFCRVKKGTITNSVNLTVKITR